MNVPEEIVFVPSRGLSKRIRLDCSRRRFIEMRVVADFRVLLFCCRVNKNIPKVFPSSLLLLFFLFIYLFEVSTMSIIFVPQKSKRQVFNFYPDNPNTGRVSRVEHRRALTCAIRLDRGGKNSTEEV